LRRAATTREEDEGLKEAMAARVRQHPGKMALRKQPVGHPSGRLSAGLATPDLTMKKLGSVRAD